MAVRLAVAFEVFEGVFQFNAMVLQEGIDFHAGLEAQQAAQLGSGDLAGTVGFERQGFQGSAGQVLALCREGREEFVWKRNGDVLHGFRIPEESLKSTSGSGAGDAGVPVRALSYPRDTIRWETLFVKRKAEKGGGGMTEERPKPAALKPEGCGTRLRYLNHLQLYLIRDTL